MRINEKLSNFYGHIHVFENALKVLDGEMTMEEYPIKKEEVMNVVSIIEAFYKSDKLGREVTFAELEKIKFSSPAHIRTCFACLRQPANESGLKRHKSDTLRES